MEKSIDALPARLFGLTLDDVDEDDLDNIVAQIEAIKKDHPGTKPIVRIVFDFATKDFEKQRNRLGRKRFEKEAKEYRPAVERISQHAFVMGEVVDSSEVYRCHYDAHPTRVYVERTEAYAKILGDLVDVWEVGNEINGEWVGWLESAWEDPTVTVQAMAAARSRVKAELEASLKALVQTLQKQNRKAVTAVTFYFNDDDAGKHSFTDTEKRNAQTGELEQFGREYGMMKWVYDCRTIFADVDYLFISYYQDDNYSGEGANRKPIIPDFAGWARIFEKINTIYPNAKFGFGEVGPQCYYLKGDDTCKLYEANEDWKKIDVDKKCDRTCRCSQKAQAAYVSQYYQTWNDGIRGALPASIRNSYIGGYFYWYFKQDGVNHPTPEISAAFHDAFARWFPLAE